MQLFVDAIITLSGVGSSLGIWLGTYVFHRWIPGHVLPPVIYTLLIINLTAAAARYFTTTWPQSSASLSAARPSQDRPKTDKPPLRPLDAQIKVREARENGRSSARSWSTLLTTIVNVLLTATVADVVYRGPLLYSSHDLSFARAGFVSDIIANILIREPNLADLPVFLSYRKVDDPTDDAWKAAGAVHALSNETDFTYPITITGLQPETRYQYATSTNHSGYFLTAPTPGHHPHRNQGVYTFVTSSCLKPRFPYDPLSHPLSIPGLRHLARWIPDLQPQFMLFLGDFIYVDVPKRFGVDIESYRRQYRMTYNSPDWPMASSSLPWIHVLDDHDIANDWDRNTTGVYKVAMDPWRHYHTSVNPPAVRPGATYFSFTQGPASFFMLDTRRYRSSEAIFPADHPDKTMLGPEQLADLLTWLRRPEPRGVRWKMVVSSVPFTKNWRFNTKDTWGGYLAERRTVLKAMWDTSTDDGVGVVLLSGDRHEFGATSFPPPAGGRWPVSATVHEFSTSPLNQFWFPKRTYEQQDSNDVPIKYIPEGQSKFGAVEISSPGPNSDQSVLKYRLFINGREVWSYLLTTPA